MSDLGLDMGFSCFCSGSGQNLAAILKNYQNENDPITVPGTIVEYMDGKDRVKV
jgi:seryl-tRNA synthetase